MNEFYPLAFLGILVFVQAAEGQEKHEEEQSATLGEGGGEGRVGDFIKNSCVWELLSEPSLPDQGLRCQPSLQSTSE